MTKYEFLIDEKTGNFNREMGHKQLSALYEIAYQLKRMADLAERVEEGHKELDGTSK